MYDREYMDVRIFLSSTDINSAAACDAFDESAIVESMKSIKGIQVLFLSFFFFFFDEV